MNGARWQLISDLHLAPGIDRTRTGQAFAGLVDAMESGREEHLVLLGDAVEVDGFLDDGGFAPAVARSHLLAVLETHPWLVSRMRRVLRHGHHLHVVLGNHDVGLGHPEVWLELEEALGSGEGLHLHPWFLHVPGLLYAEHGHQHHQLHRLPDQVSLTAPDLPDPTASALTTWSRESGVRRAQATAVAWRRQIDAERRSGHGAHALALSQVAAREGLGEMAASLHTVTRLSWGRSIGGTLGRHLGLAPSDYLAGPAQRISRLLASRGPGVAVIAFGHSHRVARRVLADGTHDVRTGTWLSPEHPVVEVHAGVSPWVLLRRQSADGTGA